MNHFVHYLKRRVAVVNYLQPNDPWFVENQAEDQGFDRPSYHVTRAVSGPAARVEKGDTIWLFSQLQSPWGTIPVALDAKIIVRHVTDSRSNQDSGAPAFRYEADTGSRWYPLFDAATYLDQLETVDGKGNIRELIGTSQHPGASMRRMRQVADAAKLIELEDAISSLGTDFISYRLIDGTRAAFEQCRTLVSRQKTVWWDRWSLPRRLAERREIIDDEKLNSHILQQVRSSQTVWGIESPRYSELESYSRKEQKLALKLGKYRAQQL